MQFTFFGEIYFLKAIFALFCFPLIFLDLGKWMKTESLNMKSVTIFTIEKGKSDWKKQVFHF